MSEFRNPKVEVTNLIQYIGDQRSKTGQPITLSGISEITGAPSEKSANRLVEELCEDGVITIGASAQPYGSRSKRYLDVDLTPAGWKQYEAERMQFSGSYGFIAMQFGDAALDPFVQDIVKPAVKEGIGCDLVDMRDVARAGVIDNIMRDQIRDAAFVIADLTHDNLGAYWEAGYAEGLGKPVIYICEKEKFEAKRTHFDTNHCTTVTWSRDDSDGFCRALIATLRRSLDLTS